MLNEETATVSLVSDQPKTIRDTDNFRKYSCDHDAARSFCFHSRNVVYEFLLLR